MGQAQTNFKRQRLVLPDSWHRWHRAKLVRRVMDSSKLLIEISNEELRLRALGCRHGMRFGSERDLSLIEVFSLVREISARTHSIRHHAVQIDGALAMADGCVAEMRTGEGKTLTSLMTVTYLALAGRGCHVLTANEYLAARDCEYARPVLDYFGLTAAVLDLRNTEQDRAACYRASVTYGSEKEFGFDFLRDRLETVCDADTTSDLSSSRSDRIIQGEHAYALIDEADSILIDQASTPLIISLPRPHIADELELLHWCDQYASELLADSDFALEPRTQSARLTQRGCRRVRLTSRPAPIGHLSSEAIFRQVEKSLAARHFFQENKEYLVIDGRLEIIDQGTGRVLPGRKWRDGLQQAIEVRAGLQLSDSIGTAARVTLQSYLNKYEFVCGMTGTASEASNELHAVYRLRVIRIPGHRPCRLQALRPRIFINSEQKWRALVDDLQQVTSLGRAALVGTTTIESSERCAAELRLRGLEVQVLHARHHADESVIVGQAGQPGRITVATNMAGRGTDIKLHPSVRDAGGLHVVISEMNRSARIDRQLAGRAARQGDPGSFQIFVSLQDELLTVLGQDRIARLRRQARGGATGELDGRWLKYFQQAQRLSERRGERERRQLMRQERSRHDALIPLGLDPYVELPDEE